MNKQKFFGDWTTYDGMIEDFIRSAWDYDKKEYREADLPEGFPKESEILIAAYTYESYSGSAYVLFKKNGRYYEVNGSHCSCYGLEGQWEPEECSIASLKAEGRKKKSSESYYFLSSHPGDTYVAYWTLVDKMKEK